MYDSAISRLLENDRDVRGRVQRDGPVVVVDSDGRAFTRENWQTLSENDLALRLRLTLLLLHGLHPVEEILTALGGADVLDAQVDALLELFSPDDLVDLHTECALVHGVNNASPAVVVLVGHAPVHGTVALDVHDVSNLVVDEVLLGELMRGLLPEGPGEHVARARAVPERVRHLKSSLGNY